MASKSKLEDLNLSKDELKRLENAFKDDKFRELFCEYAQEISDPENRRRYEEEITQMEEERGMDVTFIRPEPGYVLKTSVDGEKKAFINISKSDKIDKPSTERKQNEDGKSGLMWHIPHSFAPPREDHDKQKTRCMVYDFVVHPDTYRMAESNARFKKLVEDTAMDGIERQFQVKLDRKNVKRPKMEFKGTPSATVIRSRKTSGATPAPDASELLKDMPYPYDDKTTLEKMKEREQNLSRKQEQNKGQANKAKSKDEATTPKYTIIHRSEVDMQEYRNAPDAKPSTRPRELVIKIELPLLKSAAQANLDIFEKRLCLESSPPTAYKLDLNLPYPVDDSKGSAKFDKQKKTLVVTLPVVPGDLPTVPSFISDETAGNESETSGISAASSLKESIPVEKPLIEVLSNGTDPNLKKSETTQQEDTLKKENDLTDAGSVSNGDSGIHLSAAVSYSLPDFSFTQDTETVTILLKVKNVTENSIKHMSPSSHEIDFVCTSRGEGGFPLHFRLFLRFTESCMIVPEHCTVDVADDNVVLLLLKDRGSRGLWDQFWAGLDSDHLEKHLFLTTSNLQQQMEELEESSTDMGQVPPMPPAAAATEVEVETPPTRLEVTAMNEKKLTIKIYPPGKARSKGRGARDEEDDEYDPPSSAEIEVVHSHPTSPSLHGILKQTISESSEEAWQDGADTPPQSSNEEDLSPTPPTASSPGKRRTVSFSEHIDKATFKASASVNSMKTVLKSKRRRQRKFEEKKEKSQGGSRRRHNSTGSEGSLSDSHPSEEEVVGGGEDYGLEEQVGVGSADPARRVWDFRTTSDVPSAGRASGCGDSTPKGSENHEEGEHLGDRKEVEVFHHEAEKGENLDDREEVEVFHHEAVRGENLGVMEEVEVSHHKAVRRENLGVMEEVEVSHHEAVRAENLGVMEEVEVSHHEAVRGENRGVMEEVEVSHHEAVRGENLGVMEEVEVSHHEAVRDENLGVMEEVEVSHHEAVRGENLGVMEEVEVSHHEAVRGENLGVMEEVEVSHHEAVRGENLGVMEEVEVSHHEAVRGENLGVMEEVEVFHHKAEKSENLDDREEVEVSHHEVVRGENLGVMEEVEVSHHEAVRGENLGVMEEVEVSHHEVVRGENLGVVEVSHHEAVRGENLGVMEEVEVSHHEAVRGENLDDREEVEVSHHEAVRGENLGVMEEVEVFHHEAVRGKNLGVMEEVEVFHHEAVRGENLGDMEKVKVFHHNGTSGDREGSLADTRPNLAQGSSGVSSEGTGSSSSSKKGGSIADKIKSKLAEGATEERCEDSDDEEEESKAAPQGATNGQDTSQPGQAAGTTADNGSGNEHRTECAFHFSNDVMFDLDVE